MLWVRHSYYISPTSFNEIVPIEKQKLNLRKYNAQLVPLQRTTKMTNNLDNEHNHYDMTLLSSSESDDDSDNDEVQIMCMNNSNTSTLSKQVDRKLANESSTKGTPIADNDPDIIQCYLSGERLKNTWTKTVKHESLHLTIAREFSPNANRLSDNDPDIAEYYS